MHYAWGRGGLYIWNTLYTHGNAASNSIGYPDVTKRHKNEKEHMYAVDDANKSTQAPECLTISQRDQLPDVARVLHRY